MFMKTTKSIFSFLFAILILSCTTGNKEKSNSLTSVEKREGWELLFDGKSLDKWEMFNGGELKGWSVSDGEIHASGAGWDKNEDLITKNVYDNFDLYLEWKITPANSSGIFYHVEKGTSDAMYESAPEYQLLDDKGWPEKMKPNQYTGANYAMHAPEGALPKPAGEWNVTRIVVDFPHVEHWLNGVKVVEYNLWDDDWMDRKAAGKWADVPTYGIAKSGHIGLQNAGVVMFRNIKIKEL